MFHFDEFVQFRMPHDPKSTFPIYSFFLQFLITCCLFQIIKWIEIKKNTEELRSVSFHYFIASSSKISYKQRIHTKKYVQKMYTEERRSNSPKQLVLFFPYCVTLTVENPFSQEMISITQMCYYKYQDSIFEPQSQQSMPPFS